MSGEWNLWIVDTMVSMTLLMVAVLLIRKPVAHFFGANISYLLWALPLARLFMPTLTLEAPAAVEAAEIAGAPFVASGFNAITEQTAATASAFASIDWVLIAIIIWIGGAGILFISKLASYFQFREDIVSDGQLVGRHGNIKILETAAVGGPLAFGVFQRYIAVPTDFFQSYSPRERELALDHEIAHHESGDLAANFIGLLILSLHWFNPVAWLAWIAFRQDQETACDARILQQSGRKVRAVYGRTIAKSVSGHRLGLASPLGQKNKIKDRLKMLGQSEKSNLRKRLGALMVGAGTVIALPLTATVTYAVEAEALPTHKDTTITNDGLTVDVTRNGVVVRKKLAKVYKYTVKNKRGSFDFQSDRRLYDKQIAGRVRQMKASRPEAMASSAPPPAPPIAPTAPRALDLSVWSDKDDEDDAPLNITITGENSQHDTDRAHARKIRINGRTIIVHTDSSLGGRESRALAEESRREAEEARREHMLERNERHRESLQERREAARDLREAERDIREAQRKARKEAHNARRKTSSVWSIANQISEISFAPRAPRTPKPPRVSTPKISLINCNAIGKDLAFNSGYGVLTERARAAVVGCSGYEPKTDKKKLLKMTLKVLQESRSAALACRSSDVTKAKKLRVFDREIKHLRRKLTTV